MNSRQITILKRLRELASHHWWTGDPMRETGKLIDELAELSENKKDPLWGHRAGHRWIASLETAEAAELLATLAYRQGGLVTYSAAAGALQTMRHPSGIYWINWLTQNGTTSDCEGLKTYLKYQKPDRK